METERKEESEKEDKNGSRYSWIGTSFLRRPVSLDIIDGKWYFIDPDLIKLEEQGVWLLRY